MNIKETELNNTLCGLNGGYFVIKRSYDKWTCDKADCRKGLPPVFDGRFKAPKTNTLSEMTDMLVNNGFPNERLVITDIL